MKPQLHALEFGNTSRNAGEQTADLNVTIFGGKVLLNLVETY
jgi:hypothetical protein